MGGEKLKPLNNPGPLKIQTSSPQTKPVTRVKILTNNQSWQLILLLSPLKLYFRVMRIQIRSMMIRYCGRGGTIATPLFRRFHWTLALLNLQRRRRFPKANQIQRVRWTEFKIWILIPRRRKRRYPVSPERCLLPR